MPRLSEMITPEMLASLGARQSGMDQAATMVGAGAPNMQREAVARQLAQRAAQQSGVADAASSAGAAPSRGQAIRARLAELRAGGLAPRDAVVQAAREGLLPGRVAAQMLTVPDAVR